MLNIEDKNYENMNFFVMLNKESKIKFYQQFNSVMFNDNMEPKIFDFIISLKRRTVETKKFNCYIANALNTCMAYTGRFSLVKRECEGVYKLSILMEVKESTNSIDYPEMTFLYTF